MHNFISGGIEIICQGELGTVLLSAFRRGIRDGSLIRFHEDRPYFPLPLAEGYFFFTVLYT